MSDLPIEISQSRDLPSPPSVAVEILRISKDADSSIDDLVAVLSLDAALSSRVLALVASPKYRRGREISSVSQAATVLGMKAITMLSLSFSLSKDLQTGENTAFDYELFWRHSLTTAVAARALARFAKLDVAEEAFLCGLLARIGQLTMASTLGPVYDGVLAQYNSGFPEAASEKAVLGYDFHRVGRALLCSWGLPTLISDCVGEWGTETTSESDDDSNLQVLCRFLRIADNLATLLCTNEKGQSLTRVHTDCGTYLGMCNEEVDEFIVGLEDELATTTAAFGNQESNSLDVASILNEARVQATDLAIQALADAEQVNQENARLEAEHHQLKSAASTDSLTQLANRRAFEERLSAVVAARLRGQLSDNLGLLILDVDHFKKVNDTYGHLAGDHVLAAVGKLMVDATRDTDFVARYGGEEFVMILPNTTLLDLESVAERLRETVAGHPISADGQVLRITISVGGACVERVSSEKDAETLLRHADECLYKCKESGRNCTKVEQIGRFDVAEPNSETTSLPDESADVKEEVSL